MKAVVLPQPGTVSVERLDDRAPAPDQVVVASDGCGICGTDIHIIDVVVIRGAGTIGLILCSLAVNQPAGSVSVVDRKAARLPGATAAGADHVALGAKELDRPEGSEIVIDATASPAAQEDALRHVRRGGTFLVFGVADKDAMASFSPFRVYNDEPTIIGSMAPLHSFERTRHRWRRHHRGRRLDHRPRGARGRYGDAAAAFRQVDLRGRILGREFPPARVCRREHRFGVRRADGLETVALVVLDESEGGPALAPILQAAQPLTDPGAAVSAVRR